MPHPLWPAALLAAVALIAALISTSATFVSLDAGLGRIARAATAEVPHHLGFALSALAATDVVLPLTVAAATALLVLRHWRGALALVLAVVATQLVVDLIKGSVARPRPAMNEAIAGASGFSFPSAHSATSVALYATLGLLAAGAVRTRGARIAVIAAAAVTVSAVGLSRVLLAAHYPADVLAGWLIGAALAAGSVLLVRRLRLPRPLARAA